jgi:hypothetical protein
MTHTLLTISPRVAALAVGLPAQRAIAQRFSAMALNVPAIGATGTRWNGPKFFGLRAKPSKGTAS